MNVEIGTEAAQFPEKEYINGIFVAVRSTTEVGLYNFSHLLQTSGKFYGTGRLTKIIPVAYPILKHPWDQQTKEILAFAHRNDESKLCNLDSMEKLPTQILKS